MVRAQLWNLSGDEALLIPLKVKSFHEDGGKKGFIVFTTPMMRYFIQSLPFLFAYRWCAFRISLVMMTFLLHVDRKSSVTRMISCWMKVVRGCILKTFTTRVKELFISCKLSQNWITYFDFIKIISIFFALNSKYLKIRGNWKQL